MAQPASSPAHSAQEHAWPDDSGRRLLFLLETASTRERNVLARWVEARKPEGTSQQVELVSVPSPRASSARVGDVASLEAALAADDDPLLAPLRVAWMPREDASRGPSLWRFMGSILFGDPYEPGRLRQWWISKSQPDRCRVIVGEPAPLGELRARWHNLGGVDRSETGGLSEFVARQATITLERAERRLRGMRYKVPRFVHEAILSRPGFQGGMARKAWELARGVGEVSAEARSCLREIAATHSPYVIDLTAQLCRVLYRRGYGDNVRYDREKLENIYALAQRHPVVFLPSHKSNLDHLVLLQVLHENGHPPNHTAGGINMNFLPVGPLMRRSGVFFIRRTFKDSLVYKFVLGQYIDYLIEKRFPLEWYIEGGRSRSGKLLPPRFGLLAYVVDSYRRAKSEDVYLLPVSIAYDQIQDVGAYVQEQQGGAKERESFGWFIKVIRSLRKRYGGIYLSFGEPLSLRDTLGNNDPDAEPNADDRSVDLQKIAFEVAVRINRVTPITPTSLVTMALLGAGDRAMTLDETREAVDDFISYAQGLSLPCPSGMKVGDTEAVRATLEGLMENGVVSCFDGGPESVYAIQARQHLTAAYYRNTIIHFFVNAAIVELALVRAAEPGVEDPESEFWQETLELRDLLKFEFFFSDKDEFRAEIERTLAARNPDWEAALRGGRDNVLDLLHKLRPYTAHLVLRPFLEAYRVVGDCLATADDGLVKDEAAFLKQCLGTGKQYSLQKKIRNAESVSKVFFQTALRLARNRGVSGDNSEADAGERKRFASELRRAVRRVDAIDALASARRAGLLG
jgi:glycerol-3-phosphate O-acyltransferase